MKLRSAACPHCWQCFGVAVSGADEITAGLFIIKAQRRFIHHLNAEMSKVRIKVAAVKEAK